MPIVFFIIILAVLILSHEFGHFIVAKKSGIRVDEFGFGFPPRIFKIQKGETTYSLNLIPFGGFVKIHGEDGSTTLTTGGNDKDDARSFASKSISIRAAVIIAGVIFNLILAWVLISGGLMVGLPSSASGLPASSAISDVKIMIVQVVKDSPAEQAGLKAGDAVVEFSTIAELQKFIDENKGREIEIKYQRGQEFAYAKLTPRASPPDGEGATGIALDEVGMLRLPWHRALWEGLKMTCLLTAAVATGIFYFIADAFRGAVGFEEISGPVGIVGMASSASALGFIYLLSFAASLSVHLAVLNIIPFPALDGGRLLFLLIEKIKGSPVNPRVGGMVHGIGMALLLLLMVIITYKDILKLF